MRRTLLSFAASCVSALGLTLPADGQTVIDVPPSASPASVSGDTVLNLYDQGGLPRGFEANSGSTVNIVGGSIGQDFIARDGSTVNIYGGGIDRAFNANSGSTVNIYGGEFRLNGETMNGLYEEGDTLAFNLPDGSLLSGALTDGTPFALSSLGSDVLADGTVTLLWACFPPPGPPIVNIPGDEIPWNGIREGRTLNLSDGGELTDNFSVGWNSTLNMTGGRIGGYLELAEARAIISGGTINGLLDAYYSTVSISGGRIDGGISAQRSTVNISGGTVLNDFEASRGTEVNITGSEFLLDGLPIAGLDESGDSVIVTQRGGSVLEAVLRDGAPLDFVLNDSRGDGDYFDTQATLRLTLASLLLGDLTNNGYVDFQDLTVLLANWNKNVGIDAGNLVNADTTPVNFEDLTVLLADWTGPAPAGSPESPMGVAAVPEPSTLMLAVIATLGLSFYRRRG